MTSSFSIRIPNKHPCSAGLIAIATRLSLQNVHVFVPTDQSLTHSALSQQCQFTVEETKSTVSGITTTARAMIRQAAEKSLYNEQVDSPVLIAVDQWLARIGSHSPRLAEDLLNALVAQKGVPNPVSIIQEATTLSLVDYLVWSAVRSVPQVKFTKAVQKDTSIQAWLDKMEALNECATALKLVESGGVVDAKSAASEAATTSTPYLPVMESVTEKIRLDIVHALQKLFPSLTDQTFLFDILLTYRAQKANVEFSADLTLAAPQLVKWIPGSVSPAALAAQIAQQWPGVEGIEKVSSQGVFVHFFFDRRHLRNAILEAANQQEQFYGCNKSGQGKTVVVEFSSPNIAKPFHAGHLRSTIIGNFMKHALKANGWKVISMNFLGDWGKQYGLLAIGFERFGEESLLQQDPIRHLFDVYVKINALAKEQPEIDEEARQYFARMEQGDSTALAMWRRFRDLSIEKYAQIYRRLNVEFDVYSGESLYEEAMKGTLQELKEKQILRLDQGAWIADFSADDMGVAVLQKSNGTTLYLTRDVAAACGRFEEYHFDRMYYVVALAQELHLRQLFKLLKMAEKPWADRCQHIGFGMVQGMSTRKGNVVFLEDILNEAQQTMHQVMQKNAEKYAHLTDPMAVADIVGLTAVVVQDMSARRCKDYEFNLERMTSFEGDTGPYLQFAHARLCSIERKFVDQFGDWTLDQVQFDALPVHTTDSNAQQAKQVKAAHTLIQLISQYPDVVLQVAQTMEPCNVVNYLFSLSHAVSSALESLWVVNETREVALARMVLYRAARIVLGNGLRLLGLIPLERM